MSDRDPLYDTEATPDEQAELWKKVQKIRFAMLTTRSAQGELHSRPMTLQQVEGTGSMWFFTSANTELESDVRRDAAVNVSFADVGDSFYLSAAGRCYFIHDRAKVEELWSPMAAAWFTEGASDPDLWLLRVDCEHVDYWTTKAGKIVQMVAMLKAAVTHTRPGAAVGEHGSFGVR